MHGECMTEEVVGARKGLGAAGAGIGPAAAVFGGEVALEMVLAACCVGTFGAYHNDQGTCAVFKVTYVAIDRRCLLLTENVMIR